MKKNKAINLEELSRNSLNFGPGIEASEMKENYNKLEIGSIISFPCMHNDFSSKLVLQKKGKYVTTLSRWEKSYDFFDYKNREAGRGFSATKAKLVEDEDSQVIYKRKFKFDANTESILVREDSSEHKYYTPESKYFKRYDKILRGGGL